MKTCGSWAWIVGLSAALLACSGSAQQASGGTGGSSASATSTSSSSSSSSTTTTTSSSSSGAGGAGGASSGSGGAGGNTPDVCTSMTMWSGNSVTPRHEPGKACGVCHAQMGGPILSIQGTVYPTAHEPDGCYGVDGVADGTIVEITDATNKVTKLPVTNTGNFYSSAKLMPPFDVVVRRGGKTSTKMTAVTSGDCNTCHTQHGSGNPPAAGRIVAP